MRKGVILPVVVAVLSAAACGDDKDPTSPGPTARVRFFNATTGLTGSGGFTIDGQFAAGSALAFGQSTQTCATVNAGSTSFGFGVTNSSGTDVSGVVATLNNQNLTAGGNYTVVTAGPATSATLFLLDNNFSGSLGNNQATVRFVNLAPETGTSTNSYTVLAGTLGSGPTSVVASEIAVGAPTAFKSVTIGSNAFTILRGHTTIASGSDATLDFQAGTANTVAIVPKPGSEEFQLINIPRCS
jgi:hypothetical protein